TPGPEHLNFLGSVHGGYLFAVADMALSVASNSWGRIAVAISVDFHYLTATTSGEELDFTARERSRGRTIATYAL
ncbi:MAG: PaaI family thioesterase, partial [Acidimicrobiales bacterium]